MMSRERLHRLLGLLRYVRRGEENTVQTVFYLDSFPAPGFSNSLRLYESPLGARSYIVTNSPESPEQSRDFTSNFKLEDTLGAGLNNLQHII